MLLCHDDGKPWDKSNWQMWRVDRWAPACRAAGLDPVPRPYEYADVRVMPMWAGKSSQIGLIAA
jgi:hypothetical protein